MNKSELIDWLQNEYRMWEELLDRIGPVRMEQPGVNGDWSMKDIVAHLTGWNRWLITRLQAAQRGESEPPPLWPGQLQSDDEINVWIGDQYFPVGEFFYHFHDDHETDIRAWLARQEH